MIISAYLPIQFHSVRGHPFNTYSKFFQNTNISYPLYQGVRNVSFSKDFAYVRMHILMHVVARPLSSELFIYALYCFIYKSRIFLTESSYIVNHRSSCTVFLYFSFINDNIKRRTESCIHVHFMNYIVRQYRYFHLLDGIFEVFICWPGKVFFSVNGRSSNFKLASVD